MLPFLQKLFDFMYVYLTCTHMYTKVKIHLKSGVLASVWYCKMQVSQSFRRLGPTRGLP